MEPWYKIAQPRKEVREGRSFNPDEFAIALEQIIAGTAPTDYKDPIHFFQRTCFTRALREHAGMVLRRLSGKTANTAPVLTLVTQFGGGKTHTLATLYHIVKSGQLLYANPETSDMLSRAQLPVVENVKVAVFVGNAWDPKPGCETPWIHVAQQLAGKKGVEELGPAAKTTAPGTEALARVFGAAGGPVLILFDEVLNFVNRHRSMADAFYAFIQNLTVAMTGTTHSAAVISLPRSQVEMSEWDIQWQEKITKIVRRVAKDLIANDETEISEVIRRRLFEDIGTEKIRKNVAKAYADWCFERRAQLPPEWTAVDTAATEAKARENLRQRFETCYPFHPATLSVFQRKWSVLPQYQQTRGTLAMLAQWISWAYRDGFIHARNEPLITLGSAPLDISEFRSVVLGQLGESRLVGAIDADICGIQSHARALDCDTKGPLKDIHRRVATAILFESSGGQKDKLAHLPELRFALGEPQLDTTSIDTAASALESKAFFILKRGTDGFQIRFQPTMKKVVNDRKASLDYETEIKPAIRELVKSEFQNKATVPLIFFPPDSTEIQDAPKLTIVVLNPEWEWSGNGSLRQQIAEWTRLCGKSPRLYPGSLIWCIKKTGRELREKTELWKAWERVDREVAEGLLGSDFDKSEKIDIKTKVAASREAAKDEVWGGYRFAVLYDPKEPDGLKVIDLGAGHSSGSETLSGRIITALRSQGLLSQSVGAGYLERSWPPALKDSGAWPLVSLRQSFLNGSLTRLQDPDSVLQGKIVEFVGNGDFGLASGPKPDGTYDRVWYNTVISADEVVFDSGVFLLTRAKAQELTQRAAKPKEPTEIPVPTAGQTPPQSQPQTEEPTQISGLFGQSAVSMFRINGQIPPELWNRLGTRILPKLRSGKELKIEVAFSVKVEGELSKSFELELRQILSDMNLTDSVQITK